MYTNVSQEKKDLSIPISYTHCIPDFFLFIVHAKYTGTGHADTSKYDWLVNQHRDTYASFIGHPNLLNYIALVENESLGRVRFQFMEVRSFV
jgi:hypothetical protein